MLIVAKVNGKELPGKPTIKWFKGKWMELGIKSGARFSFKETHDAANKVRPRDMGGGQGHGEGARGTGGSGTRRGSGT